MSVREWREHGKLKPGPIIKVIILTRLSGLSISSLFGEYCSGDSFSFDETVLKPVDLEAEEKELQEATQATQASLAISEHNSKPGRQAGDDHDIEAGKMRFSSDMEVDGKGHDVASTDSLATSDEQPVQCFKRGYGDYISDDDAMDDGNDEYYDDKQHNGREFTSSLSMRHSVTQREAYYNMLEYMNNDIWTPIGLISTGHNHTKPDKEL